ncbi:MAG TPA: amidohydrolase family protein, partial [Candidatus Methanoperedenaceae archaeon]|nr:amidohydrolase family protein [Candidatus Methanoperedenaceae archaeon]
MPDTVIKNARIILGGILQPAEIAIERGRISKLGKVIGTSPVNTVIDAHGALVLPGAIDVHVHFRDPGYTHKEDWVSGSCAAAAGGVTAVVDQPNTSPPTLDPDSFRKKQKAARRSIVDFCINAGVTRANISALRELWELGALAFGEIFLAESTGSAGAGYEVLFEALPEIARLGARACVHAEDAATINEASALLAKEIAPESHSRMRPELAEAVAIARTLEAAGSSGADVHISHVSTREGVGLVREAKRKKQAVTCEVTPHHLFLTDRDCARLGTLGKMNP